MEADPPPEGTIVWVKYAELGCYWPCKVEKYKDVVDGQQPSVRQSSIIIHCSSRPLSSMTLYLCSETRTHAPTTDARTNSTDAAYMFVFDVSFCQ